MWNVCQWASSEIDMTTEWSVSVAEWWCGIVRVISKLRDKSQDKNVEKNVKMKSRPHIRSAPVWCATPSGRWHINARLCVLWQCEEERSDELCWLTRELYKSNIWIISHHARYAHAHRTLSLTLHARVSWQSKIKQKKSRRNKMLVNEPEAKLTTLTECKRSEDDRLTTIVVLIISPSHNLPASRQLPCGIFRAALHNAR